MDLILDVLSWILLSVGSLILVLAAVVILRMPTFYTRLHAAGVNETLGPALVLTGLALQIGDYASGLAFVEILFKLGLIFVFLMITSPVASHALAKAALDNGVMPGALKRARGDEGDQGGSDGGTGGAS